MIHIQRKQPSNKLYYFVILGIIFVFCIFPYFGLRFMSDMIIAYPDMYRKLVPVAIISFMLVVYGVTCVTNPYFRGKRQEKKMFTAKHGTLQATGYKWAGIVLAALTVLPIFFVVANAEQLQWFTENRTLIFIVWGVIGIIQLALFRFEMRRASARVMSFVNTHIPDTKLNVTEAQISKSGTLFSFDGDFRGRAVEYFSEVSSVGGGMGQTKCRMSTKEMPKEFANLSVTDREPQWRSYTGNTVDDVFQQRFEVEGADIGDLPEEFKKVLVHMPRALRMEFHNTYFDFIYDATPKHAPFYTYHGIILFLDDMSEVADSIG